MTRGSAAALVLLISIITLTATISAHAPEFPQGNDGLDQATEIEDPTKSWALYSQLQEGGDANYYLLRMEQGENITLSLTAPQISTERGFRPSMALMGPGIEDEGSPPSFLQVPDGVGVKVVTGEQPSAMEYEPFSPSAFYEMGELSLEAPQDGDYYLAVYDGAAGGNYGLAVGLRESFTAEEWLLVPFSAISIYQWEGQDLAAVLAPPVVAFLVGLAIMLIASRRNRPRDVLWIMATSAGLLMAASGVSLLYQMLWSLAQTGSEVVAVVTIIFAAAVLALGIAACRIALRDRSPDGVPMRTRVALLAIGALGLLLWGGWIVGPAIAILAALLPSGALALGLGQSVRLAH
ncbi:MAG: hypothetical protein SA339_10420 [Methanomassiliicoccus sp.]|nr:hypothetical protein [Methanomassiliicoccus sp.]